MENFALKQFGSEATEIFDQARQIFGESHIDSIRALTSKVPTSFVDQDTPIRIVFAGQYSAGKSTILSQLTGVTLKSGGGIVTDKLQKIDWNGITVYDTPGIHTQLHPDHDQITYDAISQADLLVFMLTGEGFSDYLGNHFRKLLVDMGKGNEMMLVVNKMEDTVMGNTPEQQKVFLESNLLPVISPEFTPEQLYTTFIDAKSYLEAIEESDPEEREFLTDISGFKDLEDNLNRFISDKGLLGRCTSNLYILEQMITEAMAQFSTGDTDVDLTRQYLTRNRRVLVESRDRIKDKSFTIVRNNTADIKRWGNEIANTLTTKDDQDSVNSRLEQKYEQVNLVPQKISQQIAELIGEESQKISQHIESLNNSQLGTMFIDAVKTTIKEHPINPKTAQKLNAASSKATEFGKLISQWSTGPNTVGGLSNLTKLGNYSGSQMHQAVLKVGHFFGKKFVPWEAVKWARGIGVAGKALGVAGSVLGIFLQISSDNAESKMEEQLQSGRSEIRACFDEAADVIDMEFDQQTQQWIQAEMNPKIQDIDSKLDDIDSMIQNQNAEYQALSQLLARTRNLICKIQRS